jgi:hypothetical protein
MEELLSMEPNRTLTWLEDPAGREFNELVKAWAEKEYRKLRESHEDITVFRAQGALEYLDKIASLPAEIRTYLHDVSTGKRKKIERKVLNGMVR